MSSYKKTIDEIIINEKVCDDAFTMVNHANNHFGNIGRTISVQFSHDDPYLYLTSMDNITTLFECSTISLGDLQQTIMALYNSSPGLNNIRMPVFKRTLIY